MLEEMKGRQSVFSIHSLFIDFKRREKTWCWCGGGFPFFPILLITVVLHPGRYTHTLTHCTLSVRVCRVF